MQLSYDNVVRVLENGLDIEIAHEELALVGCGIVDRLQLEQTAGRSYEILYFFKMRLHI